ncbi:MAG: DNA polymerase III subunit beta [Clostridium celatum]|nr:DNA polymerase III subunit beta [Clostridium celatum]
MEIKINVADMHNIIKLTNNNVLVTFSAWDSVLLTSYTVDGKERVDVVAPGESEEFSETFVISKDVIKKLPKTGELILTDSSAECGSRKIEFDEIYIDLADTEVTELVNTFTVEEFNKLIEVESAVATDDARPIIKGICFNDNEFVALDGYRLARRRFEGSTGVIMVIPANVIKLYKKLPKGIKEVKVAASDKSISLMCNNYRIIGDLIEGNYVKYKSLIDNDKFNTCTTVEAPKLLGLIKSCIGSLVTLDIREEVLYVKSSDASMTVKDSIECDTFGDDVEMNFNPKYLVESLKNYKGEIILKTYGEISPLYIEDQENRLDMILPVRKIKKECK